MKNIKPILGIGWDVAGWMETTSNNAVAILKSESFDKIEWVGKPRIFHLSTSKSLTPLDLIQKCWSAAPENILDIYK